MVEKPSTGPASGRREIISFNVEMFKFLQLYQFNGNPDIIVSFLSNKYCKMKATAVSI